MRSRFATRRDACRVLSNTFTIFWVCTCARRRAAARLPLPPPLPRAASQADVVVGDLVAARLEPLAHPREEVALGVGLAGELYEGRLERVEREVDVEVPLVGVAARLAELVDHELLRPLVVARAQQLAEALAHEGALDLSLIHI